MQLLVSRMKKSDIFKKIFRPKCKYFYSKSIFFVFSKFDKYLAFNFKSINKFLGNEGFKNVQYASLKIWSKFPPAKYNTERISLVYLL